VTTSSIAGQNLQFQNVIVCDIPIKEKKQTNKRTFDVIIISAVLSWILVALQIILLLDMTDNYQH
jgi:hypothetical protein